MKKITMTMVALVIGMAAADASAQTDTRGANASITIPTVIGIDVTNTTVEFEEVTAASYDATTGLGSVNGLATSVISTRSNILHKVTIHADDGQMGGPGTKPAAHLQWQNVTAGGAFTGLLTTAA